MRKRVGTSGVLLVAALMATPLFCWAQGASVGERIRNVETGLVECASDTSFRASQIVDAQRIAALPKFELQQRMAAYGVPGVGVAVIDDFKVDWAKGYGLMEAGTDRRVTAETMFQSGSTSKVLMAIVVLKLVEAGRLDLDADVNAYLETWKVPAHPSGKPVTLRLLLTHQSGINRPGDGFYAEPGSSPTLAQFLKGERPALNDPVRFDHPPGSAHAYSNFGYLIMELLLQDRFHTSYSELVRRTVFEPLNLSSCFIEYPFPPQYAGRVIRPHNAKGIPSADDGLFASTLSAAGMISTPSDWAAVACELMSALAGRSDRLLSRASVEAMFRKERDVDPVAFDGLTGQGLGVFLFARGDQEYFVHHGHNSPGANCVLIGSKRSGRGAVVMTNGALGIPLAIEIVSAIAREYGWDDQP